MKIKKKHYFICPLLGGLFILVGCAGVSSDFECNETTSDRCMTMDQANQKARLKTDSLKGKQGAGALPGLVDLPPQASRSTPAVSQPLPVRPVIAPTVRSGEVEPVSNSVQKKMLAFSTTTPTTCPQQKCDNLGETHPQRSVEKLVNVWIAPWVDTNDVFHQPGRVSFVVDTRNWQLPRSVY